MLETYYQTKLFPLQDDVLRLFQDMDVAFYLTGGTALSRCYLNHRYSDDLDFFMNANPDFKTQCNKLVSRLKKEPAWNVELGSVAGTFVRIMLEREDVLLKIDFVNDVAYRSGEVVTCSIFHRVDNWRNILSNKICSLSRRDAKDLTDIIFISQTYEFNWQEVIAEAKQKDLWVDPLEICKIIKEFPLHLFETIKWVRPIDLEKLNVAIHKIHEDIFLGRTNSIVSKPK